MPSEEFNRARALLDEVESRWINLYIELAKRSDLPSEVIMKRLGDEAYDRLKNYEQRRIQSPTGRFTPFHFLHFPDYVTLANQLHGPLSQIGSPPAGWTILLNRQQGLATRYRNDLQHAGRFELLPPAEQGEALALFEQQRDWLRAWWPDLPDTQERPEIDDHPGRAALESLSADERSGHALAQELGFTPVNNPLDLLASDGSASSLRRSAGDEIARLFRIGQKTVGNGTIGLYIAYMGEWPERSAQRERYRRRLARMLIEHPELDARALIIMADNTWNSSEVELVYPRSFGGKGFGTVRAAIQTRQPTRHHLDLLKDLDIAGANSVREVTRLWNQAFSIERVTKAFYQEFKELRDLIARSLIESNPDHPLLQGRSVADLTVRQPSPEVREFQQNVNAFATRQLSRLLFLWFLQQKGWLGAEALPGSKTFLLDLFARRPKDQDSYFAEVLVPLFFDGLGERANDPRHEAVEGMLRELFNHQVRLPYVDGGLFRADANVFEQALFAADTSGNRAHAIMLPDAIFDPARDEVAATARGVSRQRTILGMLRSYRFTTQESTPDDQSVDPDPELLGKVFENLYQEDDRHETGTYYTPREIVRYMCREALDGYLLDCANVTRDTLTLLREEAIDWQATDVTLTPAQEEALTQALNDVTVVDPAVGSGAFLVGMMQEIVQLRRGIEAAATDEDVDRASQKVYDWKLHCITHNLRGVDINATAVEICRLRLWLSLVIEYDAKRLRDIRALPNLEFRVVAGDSLVDRPGEERFIHSLPVTQWKGMQSDFGTGQRLDRLTGLQRDYNEADARGDTARVGLLAPLIRAEIDEICRLQLDRAITDADSLARKLPAQQTTARRRAEAAREALVSLRDGLRPDAPFLKPLLWPLVFQREFSERGGFDIVIANPPYVRQESLGAYDQERYYKHAFPDVYDGKADLYVYFFARALQLLREGGRLAFITSNKYMRAGYGEKLRVMLPLKTQIERIVDLGDLSVFAVAAYPAVVVARKMVKPDMSAEVEVAELVLPVRQRLKEEARTPNVEGVRQELQNVDELIRTVAVPGYRQALLKRPRWILEGPALIRLFERLMNEGMPLHDYVKGRMYYGIKTGRNEAFVIDEETRVRLIAADPRSAEVIKPWLEGENIKRWTPELTGKYLIAIQNSGDTGAHNAWGSMGNEKTARHIFRRTYPAIHDHLSRWEERLRNRADQGRFWWELRPCRYYSEFRTSKVFWPENNPPSEANFAFDSSDAYCNNKVYLLADMSYSLCSYLNSPPVFFLLSSMATRLRGGWLELRSDRIVGTLPVPSRVTEFPSEPASAGTLAEVAAGVLRMSPSETRLLRDWYESRSIYDGVSEETED